MWSLPAFFNIIKKSYEVVAILKALASIINIVSLIEGNKYNIIFDSVFDFYVKNPESKILEKIEKALKLEFLDTVLY